MTGKKLRSRLFGFKKSDVFSYICEMDEKTEAKLIEKDKEISELKAEITELQKNREAIISVLQTAEANAKTIVEQAQKTADDIRERAETEAREKKEMLNREIEIKRKAVKNYYLSENRKIDQIRTEVDKMRERSIEAIRRFEEELSEVGRMTDSGSAYVNSAISYAQQGSSLKVFDDVERTIPVHIVESIGE